MQIKGQWHVKLCQCEQCTTLRAEGEKKGMLTTRDLISHAVLAPKQRYFERLKDNRIIGVTLSSVKVPGVRNHTKAYWYIDGKRISRATAALILRNHS